MEQNKKTIMNFETIQEFNDALGVETLHPLVSVIDMSQCKPMHHMRHTMSFYAIFLKEEKNCEIIYGNTKYDYNKGDVVCLAPGQIIGIEDDGHIFQPQGYALFFDPEFIRGTSLGKNIKNYGFFSYQVNEALHLSEKERTTFIECLNLIKDELNHDIDRMTRQQVCSYIEILVNYCQRFYERQFVTREPINSASLAKFETLLNNYFKQNNMNRGLPTVNYCASELCLSPNYFGDLIKKETGQTATDYIHKHIIDATKELLADTSRSITDVSYQIGFQYPQHMSRMFKKETGVTPAQYRKQITA